MRRFPGRRQLRESRHSHVRLYQGSDSCLRVYRAKEAVRAAGINRERINRPAIRGIFHARKGAPQGFLWCLGIIPATGELILIGVKSAPKAACSRRRGRQKQVCVFRILKVGFGEESEVFVRGHPEIVRSTKRGHLAFHTKKNFLRLRRQRPHRYGLSCL
jgi:hypothetical protein